MGNNDLMIYFLTGGISSAAAKTGKQVGFCEFYAHFDQN